MIKTTLIAVIVFLFIVSSVLADCPADHFSVYLSSGELIECIPLYYDFNDFLMRRPPEPEPEPWIEKLRSHLTTILDQPEVSDIITDIEVLTAMSVLVEHLSPDLRKSFHLEINSKAKKILPEELYVQFPYGKR